MAREISLNLAMKYRPDIWGRLKAENAADLSDTTLESSLGPCVCGDWLVSCAKLLRDSGLLSLEASYE